MSAILLAGSEPDTQTQPEAVPPTQETDFADPPSIHVSFDADNQGVVVQWDTWYKNFDFVIACLKMAIEAVDDSRRQQRMDAARQRMVDQAQAASIRGLLQNPGRS